MLEVICGPMYAGKSTELIRRVKRAQIAGSSVVVFKPLLDDRYGVDYVTTHDGTKIPCIPVKSPNDISSWVNTNDDVLWNGDYYLTQPLIGIDEAQFFHADNPSLHQVITELIQMGVRIVVSGLDMDFQGHPFPSMIPLIMDAERVDKLSAVCQVCGADASRSQRVVDGIPVTSGDCVQVGGSDAYEARCRPCFVF